MRSSRDARTALLESAETSTLHDRPYSVYTGFSLARAGAELVWRAGVESGLGLDGRDQLNGQNKGSPGHESCRLSP